jgi:hypothetical protein
MKFTWKIVYKLEIIGMTVGAVAFLLWLGLRMIL